MAIATFGLVALDCPDPVALAEFYQQMVGGELKYETDSDEWVTLELSDATDIGFQRVAGFNPPKWPDGAAQQAHLDFDVADLDSGEIDVLAIGARKTRVQPSPESWRVFLDPVGHPFCLVKAAG